MIERLFTYLGAQSPRTVLLALAGIALLLLAQGSLLLRQPVTDFLKARHERAALELRARAPQAVPGELARVERALAAQKRRLAAADAPAPAGGATAQVVAHVSAIAQRHGAALQTVKPAGSKRVRDFVETAFDVEITGAYRALAASMAELERELAPMVIARFTIKRDAAGKLPRLQLRLAAYWPADAAEGDK